MMRLTAIAFLVVACLSPAADAFVPNAQPAFVAKTTALSTSTDQTFSAAGSGMNEHDIPLLIKNLDASNFDETLTMLEPLLTVECVGDICDDYVGDLKAKASALGKELPEGFASTHH